MTEPARASVWLGALVLFSLMFGCAASKHHHGAPRATRDAIAALCADAERAGRLSGQVIVARDGEIIHRSTHGRASYSLDVPVTDATRFKIFSATKQFTAAAIMLLERAGRLRVTDPIRTYLPEAPASWDAVTIHHLLTHTSGIPEFRDALRMNPQRPTQLESVRAALATPEVQALAPTNTPGEAFAYSNCGYTMLGAIIEERSGMTYQDFVRSRIFQPAGMTFATVDEPVFGDLGYGDGLTDVGFRPQPGLASGYVGAPGELAEALAYMYILMGAGAVQATADDMLRYDAALRAGTVLPFDLQQRMLDSAFQQPEPDRPRVGYGWFIRQTHGRQLLSHSGGTNGYSCEFARVPSDGICIVILSNHGFANCTGLRDQILDVLYPEGFAR